MNCRECRELLQRRLDGELRPAWHPDLESHLAGCLDCRQLHAAGQQLLEGLAFLTAPLVPPGLADRIAARIQAERLRARHLRRVQAVTGLAAGLLLAAFFAYPAPRPGQPPAGPEVSVSADPTPPVPLSRGVEEASQAVVTLTRGLAEDTVDQGRILLPVVLPEPGGDVQPVPVPPARPLDSLQGVRQGVSEGLEPVATSARRAFDLLFQGIPAAESKRNAGA